MSTIAITRHQKPVRIVWRGHVVATTARALDLKEGGSPTVIYVPRADADMSFFATTDRHTRCPFKGEASYFTLHHGGERAENAVWTYETPLEPVAPIEGHLAFYPNEVTFEES